MAKNKITDLRDHLFETLEALKDEDNPMPVERAREIANVSRAIIESGKLEVKLLEVTGAMSNTGFIPQEEDENARAPVAKLVNRR